MDTMNSEQSAFFDSQADASWADEPYGCEQAPKLERLAQHCGTLVGRTVLEPGCGTGRLTQWLAGAVGPTGFVYGCDISRLMVYRALARTRGLAHVSVSHAAMENLDLGNDSVDLVVCHQVFPHFTDKPGALAYMAKVLRPGGILLIVHFESRRFINDVHRKAGTVVADDTLPERGQIEDMLHAAGLGVRYYSDDPKLGYLLKACPIIRRAKPARIPSTGLHQYEDMNS
jgi:ubiquinone/menaquinone biosynthesis C-methylase UbiE